MSAAFHHSVLYHGTSASRWQQIAAVGLRDCYLTDDEDIALYYAEQQAEDDGCEPVLLEVAVTDAQLRPDMEAWAEPVSAGTCPLAEMEDAVAAHQGEVCAADTLRIVRSVRVEGPTLSVTIADE